MDRVYLHGQGSQLCKTGSQWGSSMIQKKYTKRCKQTLVSISWSPVRVKVAQMVLEFSISVSLSRLLFPVSTDVEFESCGICVVSAQSRSVNVSVYFGVYFPKEKKLN